MASFKNTIIDDTGFIEIPAGTTAQRPGSPSQGMIRLNTDRDRLEYYNGTNWVFADTGNIAPDIVATGGTVTDITQNGVNYRVHAFTTVGTSSFQVTRGGEVDILVVGGGGGGTGDGDAGGAGGAGGLVYATGIPVQPKNYTIVVGSGGNGSSSGFGNDGNDSFFDQSGSIELRAIGGGGGGAYLNNGRAGGSGGGAGTADGSSAPHAGGAALQPGTNSLSVGTIVHDAGNIGGDNTFNDNDNGASGGGAGQPGEGCDFDDDNNSVGGDGLQVDITGSNVYYAGGGGGSHVNTGVNNPGGLGGGGAGGGGANSRSAQNGVNGTGGGGGSSNRNDRGGDGGSGIVIIRYLI